MRVVLFSKLANTGKQVHPRGVEVVHEDDEIEFPEICLDGLMQPVRYGLECAHGTGLSGAAVKSLQFGRANHCADVLYVVDAEQNAIRATADEIFALLKKIAPDYEITALRKA